MGNNHIDEYDLYIDKLLTLQFEAADMFNHMPTRGKVREEFIIRILNERFAVGACRGFVIGKTYQSEQCDIVIPSISADRREIGGETRLSPTDTLAVIEVKTSLITRHLSKFNQGCQQIKVDNPGMLCGMYAYRLGITIQSILEKFGFNYDEESQTYIQNPIHPLIYPNIDFIICTHNLIDDEGMEDDRSFFIRKNNTTANESGYVLNNARPISSHFFQLINSLRITDIRLE